MSQHDAGPEPSAPSISSAIAHELKNPAMTIQGLASTGERLYESLSDEERREFFHLIADEASRLIRVVQDTVGAIQLEAGEIAFVLRPEPLARLIRGAAEEAAGSREISIDVNEALVVRCDAKHTGAAIAAVIGNAGKFSPPDSPIEIRARISGGEVLVSVTDRGPGVSDGDRERVFDRYTTVRPPGYEGTQGAGLGLFIARAFVEAQGGSMRMERAGGAAGTMLTFSLPLEAS